MTYWVIARIQNRIYITADIRSSSALPGVPSEYMFSDCSEKLFWLDYVDIKGNFTKIGICTSGFAGGIFNGQLITIAQLLNGYVENLKNKKPVLPDYRNLLGDFYVYLEAIQKGLANYIFSQASFGVGMCFNTAASIGGYDFNQGRYIDGIDNAYLEASFNTVSLNAAHSYSNSIMSMPIYSDPVSYAHAQQNTQNGPYVGKTPKQILDSVTKPGYQTSWSPEYEAGIEFIAHIMFGARYNGNLQTISDATDVISIGVDKIVIHVVNQKHNVLFAPYQRNIGLAGTDLYTVAVPNIMPPPAQPQHYYAGQGAGFAPFPTYSQPQQTPQCYEPNPDYSL